MGWVNKVWKKSKDSRELCLIINVFIVAMLNKIRLSWATSWIRYGSQAEREPGALP